MRLSAAVLCVLVGLQGLQLSTSAHLVKEFTSAGKEAARSIEPNQEPESQPESDSNLDVGAILCEKYTDWSKWSPCSRKCEQMRVRRCRKPEECGKSWVKEKRTCTRAKGACVPLSYKVIGMQKRNRMIEELLYDLLYDAWTPWGPCTRSCRQRRQRGCKHKTVCVRSYIQEERRCQVAGSRCEHRYSLKPVGVGTNDDVTNIDDDDDDDSVGDQDDGGDVDYQKGRPEDGAENHTGIDENQTFEVGEKNTDNSPENDDDDKANSAVNATKEARPLSNRKNWWSKEETNRRRESKSYTRKERKGAALGKDFVSAQKSCGIRPRQITGSYRVVGGQEVQKNSWPWQVAILTKYQEQYCGGTLIAPRWVLTAAHCVRKKGKSRKLIVRVGEHDIDAFDSTQEDIRPEKEFPHPDFDYHTITNDIALIKLRHAPSVFTSPGYACLPSADYVPDRDQLCSIVGWGKLKNTHIYGSDSLQEAKVPVVRHRKCQRVFEYNITLKQVCAGYRRGGVDSCAGDSGGPLLCNTVINRSDRFVLYGVTSYGEGCGRKGKYGIYTKVTSYLDWIYKTISENR